MHLFLAEAGHALLGRAIDKTSALSEAASEAFPQPPVRIVSSFQTAPPLLPLFCILSFTPPPLCHLFSCSCLLGCLHNRKKSPNGAMQVLMPKVISSPIRSESQSREPSCQSFLRLSSAPSVQATPRTITAY